MQSNLFNDKIIVSSFNYPRREFIKIIQNLKRPAHIKSKEFHFVKCEMVIDSGKITMRLPGSEVYLYCDTIGICKSTFYLRDFYEAIKADKNDEICISISLNTINVNAVTLTSTTVLLSQSSKDKKIEVPLDFLNNSTQIIDKFEVHQRKQYISLDNKKAFYRTDIQIDTFKAELILKKYGVTANDIEQLVLKHLKKNT
jgi:hypothetical protein